MKIGSGLPIENLFGSSDVGLTLFGIILAAWSVSYGRC